MTLDLVTDHSDQAMSLVIDEHQGLPAFEAWVRSYVDEVQEVEQAIYDVAYYHLIDNATGVRLDVLGRIVGQPRRGQNDDTYRVYITARIAVNKSRGANSDIRRVAGVLWGPEGYSLRKTGTAAFAVTVLSQQSTRPNAQAEMVQEATSGGVSGATIYSVDPPSQWFSYGPSGVGYGVGSYMSLIQKG